MIFFCLQFQSGKSKEWAYKNTRKHATTQVLHSITWLFYYPSTVYQTLHLFWRGKQINVTVKVKLSAFRTICGFNFIPWKRVIFFYMEGECDSWIFFYNICRWTFIQWYVYIAFRRQHPCPFHFHLFCFEANINIQFPELHHLRTPTVVLYRFFHYFCPSLFAGWPT